MGLSAVAGPNKSSLKCHTSSSDRNQGFKAGNTIVGSKMVDEMGEDVKGIIHTTIWKNMATAYFVYLITSKGAVVQTGM